MYGNTHTKCRICGGPAVAGTMECLRCQTSNEKRAALYQPRGELRPIWNNASHDGSPNGYRIAGGQDNGTVVKVVTG